MTAQILPIESEGDTEFIRIYELDNVEFRFLFSWNERDTHWYLTIRTEADEEIIGCEGIKLVQRGWPIHRVYDRNRPVGELLLLSELLTEPGFDDFGDTTLLAYIPKADMDVLKND